MKESIEQKLKKIAEVRQLEYANVKKLFEDLKKRMKGKPDKLVLNAVISQLRERANVSTGTSGQAKIGYFIGFLIGDVGLRDKAEEMRNTAERCIDREGFDVAVQKGYVNEEGEVLDFRPKVFGRKNPNFGKPLGDRHIRSHRLYFIGKEASSKKFEIIHLQTNDNKLALAWCDVPFYQWVTFPALIQEHDSTGYRLTGSVAKETLTVFRAVKEERDTFEVYEEVMKPLLTPIANVEKYHEAVKEAWDRWIVTYGIIGYLGLERETMFGIPGRLLDSELGFEADYQVRFFIPEHIKINCGKYSEAYIFGRTRRSMFRDRETGELCEGDVVIDVWGMYPNPKLSTEIDIVEEDEEERIEGFIPIE